MKNNLKIMVSKSTQCYFKKSKCCIWLQRSIALPNTANCHDFSSNWNELYLTPGTAATSTVRCSAHNRANDVKA